MTRKHILRHSTFALFILGLALAGGNSAFAGWGTLPGDQVNRTPASYRSAGHTNHGYQGRGHANQQYRGNYYGQSQNYYQARQFNYNSYAPSHRHGGYSYHDTTHYDYHAPSITRHGNHFHYTPGHYDLHVTGHYDRH